MLFVKEEENLVSRIQLTCLVSQVNGILISKHTFFKEYKVKLYVYSYITSIKQDIGKKTIQTGNA